MNSGIGRGLHFPDRLSTSGVAELMQISRTTLRRWSEAGAPQNADATFDARAVVAWKIQRERDRAAEAAIREDQGDSPAMERLREARASMAEIDLGEKLGMFVRRDQVEAVWARVLVALKNRLLGMPSRLSKRLEQKDARAISKVLTETVRDLIEDTKQHMETLTADEEDDG